MIKKQRKRKTADPCPVCFLHKLRCICEFIPNLELKTRVSLIIHAKELKRTTNTGRLALHALVNSCLHVRGESSGALDLNKDLSKDSNKNSRLDLSTLLLPDYESYVLFPSDDALNIEDIHPKKPIQLIVTDGNWRQASKLNTRHPELSHLPRVKISSKNMAEHHLRKEHMREGLSTIEAIALALRAIEGAKVGDSMMALYQKKLAATLEGRGVKFD